MVKRSSGSHKALGLAIVFLFLGWAISYGQNVPAPEKVLGFKVGADYHLATYNQALEYFRTLENASPRIKLFEMGRTAMDKPMIYAVITSEENMAQLEHYKEISRKLALVKGVSEEEARKLAAEGKAVVYISGGLHASEVAPTQHHIQGFQFIAGRAPSAVRRRRSSGVMPAGRVT